MLFGSARLGSALPAGRPPAPCAISLIPLPCVHTAAHNLLELVSSSRFFLAGAFCFSLLPFASLWPASGAMKLAGLRLTDNDHRQQSQSERPRHLPAGRPAGPLSSRGVSRRKIVLSNLASGKRGGRAGERASITHTRTRRAGTHHGLECVSADTQAHHSPPAGRRASRCVKEAGESRTGEVLPAGRPACPASRRGRRKRTGKNFLHNPQQLLRRAST